MTKPTDTIKQRIAAAPHDPGQKCSTPDCGRLTMRAAGIGLAAFACRPCVLHTARHGSAWHGTYRATELAPYVKAAAAWIKANRVASPFVSAAIAGLSELLATSGPAEIVPRLRGKSAQDRSRVAFARLREAGIKPERILAIYLAVCAIIREDKSSHRVQDFTIVQVAKACHRLASGYHRRWELPVGRSGQTAPLEMHVYSRSSGRLLRFMGEAIHRVCEVAAAGEHLADVLALKVERFGPHPSTLPGWRPDWQVKLLDARSKAAGQTNV